MNHKTIVGSLLLIGLGVSPFGAVEAGSCYYGHYVGGVIFAERHSPSYTSVELCPPVPFHTHGDVIKMAPGDGGPDDLLSLHASDFHRHGDGAAHHHHEEEREPNLDPLQLERFKNPTTKSSHFVTCCDDE